MTRSPAVVRGFRFALRCVYALAVPVARRPRRRPAVLAVHSVARRARSERPLALHAAISWPRQCILRTRRTHFGPGFIHLHLQRGNAAQDRHALVAGSRRLPDRRQLWLSAVPVPARAPGRARHLTVVVGSREA